MTNIDPLLMQGFSINLEMLSQQMMAKFMPYCRTETAVRGTEAYRMLSQIAKVSVTQRTGRALAIDNTSVSYDGRWVYPKKFHFDTVLDDIDTARTAISPEGVILRDAVAAMNRQMDTDFIEAFFGTSQTGKSGGTAVTFPASQQVGVDVGTNSATGLNVAKLRAARKILADNDVNLDTEQVYIAVSPRQYDDLLALTQVTSTDFNNDNNRPVLIDGRVTRFLGMNIIESTLLSVDSNDYRRCPVWVRSGVGCGLWQPITGDLRNNPAMQGNPIVIETEAQFGFTRLEEAKCVEIKCDETEV